MCCIVFIDLLKEDTNACKFIKFTSIVTVMYIIKLNKTGQKQKAFQRHRCFKYTLAAFMVRYTIIAQNVTSKGGLQVKHTNKSFHFN